MILAIAHSGEPGVNLTVSGMSLAARAGRAGGAAVRGQIVPRRELAGRLRAAARVTQIAAPPGSGKTFLLRSWIDEAGLADSAGWVSVQGAERDPQRFWIAVADGLRGTRPGAALVQPLTAAPGMDAWAIVERLLKDLAPLGERIWLVIDDVHELSSEEVLRQLELLVMRAPAELRFMLLTRRDLRLGLHRLRLEGQLTELRASDLRFTAEEARVLFQAAGAEVPDSARTMLLDRTEGWAAGLRLAALSLAGHPDPHRFAAEFSGSERTVAGYLLAEVLERQTEEVRRLLLRTSVLERVSGELADLLTGGTGGERILQDLEEAGAFVMSLDAQRSWFRYHSLLADLLQLELRRTVPGEISGLHRAASGWLAEHGYPVEAVRHAQAAEDWDVAARLLADHFIGLYLGGQFTTVHELLAGFPDDAVTADRELAVLLAGSELLRGSLDAAEGYLRLATGGSASVPAARRGRFEAELAIVELSVAQRRGDLPAVAEGAHRLETMAGDPDAGPGLGADLRALALINLGTAELWALRAGEADRHLEQGAALAHQAGRPFLELTAMAHAAWAASFRSFMLAVERSSRAIELAREHGWTGEPVLAVPCTALGAIRVWQMRLEEAESWLDQAGQALRAETQPAAGLVHRQARGMLDLARGRDAEALAAFQSAERLAGLLVAAHPRPAPMRAHLLQALIRLGETGSAEQALADMDEQQRERGEIRVAEAALRLAKDDPQAAAAALAPVLDGSAPVTNLGWQTHAFLLGAITRDALGDLVAASRGLERALDLAEPDGVLFAFFLHPVPGLLERHARSRTAHAALISEILGVLAGRKLPPPSAQPAPLAEPISDSETRVLRCLPTNLSAPEIASQLSLSVNTVRTHMRRIYEKLGAHSRTEAVERARGLGLLAPSSRRP